MVFSAVPGQFSALLVGDKILLVEVRGCAVWFTTPACAGHEWEQLRTLSHLLWCLCPMEKMLLHPGEMAEIKMVSVAVNLSPTHNLSCAYSVCRRNCFPVLLSCSCSQGIWETGHARFSGKNYPLQQNGVLQTFWYRNCGLTDKAAPCLFTFWIFV